MPYSRRATSAAKLAFDSTAGAQGLVVRHHNGITHAVRSMMSESSRNPPARPTVTPSR